MDEARRLARFRDGAGIVAALDQSGGSTPAALAAYGIDPAAYADGAEMFDLIHAARARVITSDVFTRDRVLAAILFAGTLDRTIAGRPSAEYLWDVKGIVPFLKIDAGLVARSHGVQLMRDIPDLDALLARAVAHGVFGTKARAVIRAADSDGIARVVEQQFAVADQVRSAGLLPILEPEVDIHAQDKAAAEAMLKAEILDRLDALEGTALVAVKLTIPSVDGLYSDLVEHPRVARVLALSGGYPRVEATTRLARNPGVIASFSRALLDGLAVGQTDDEFDRILAASLDDAYRASVA